MTGESEKVVLLGVLVFYSKYEWFERSLAALVINGALCAHLPVFCVYFHYAIVVVYTCSLSDSYSSQYARSRIFLLLLTFPKRARKVICHASSCF